MSSSNEALNMMWDMVENFCGVKERKAHWVNCIGRECGEGENGYCRKSDEDFPEDGKCLHPDYIEYDPEIAALGAYEKEAV